MIWEFAFICTVLEHGLPWGECVPAQIGAENPIVAAEPTSKKDTAGGVILCCCPRALVGDAPGHEAVRVPWFGAQAGKDDMMCCKEPRVKQPSEHKEEDVHGKVIHGSGMLSPTGRIHVVTEAQLDERRVAVLSMRVGLPFYFCLIIQRVNDGGIGVWVNS